MQVAQILQREADEGLGPLVVMLYNLFPIPYSLLPIRLGPLVVMLYNLFPIPYSLLPNTY